MNASVSLSGNQITESENIVPITCLIANVMLCNRNSGQIIGEEKFRFDGSGSSKEDIDRSP
jgi:hypothetical protein